MKHRGEILFKARLKTFFLVILSSCTSYSQIHNPKSFTFQPITIGILSAPVNPNNSAAPMLPPNGMTADQVIRQNNLNTLNHHGYQPLQVPPTDPYQRDLYIKQNAQQARQIKQQAYLQEIYRILNQDLPELQIPTDEKRLIETKNYQDVFLEIQNMQTGVSEFSLKRAVFLIENAWLNNSLDYSKYSALVEKKANLIRLIAKNNNIEPTNSLGCNFIIQKLFSESTAESKTITHQPFGYDFEDYMGKTDWSKMFVTKLLDSGKGQCHSLPLLYLILAEQTSTKAWLSYAPEHSYIMFSDDAKQTFYNFETTNGNLVSIDWIMESGFVNTQSIRNRIYLDTLSKNQLISTLVADLVMGYTNKFGYDEFVGSMVDYILTLHPKSIQGLIFKADLQVLKTEQALKKAGNPPIQDIQLYPDAYSNYAELLRQYDYIDALGYSRLPEELYEKWLASANAQKTQPNAK